VEEVKEIFSPEGRHNRYVVRHENVGFLGRIMSPLFGAFSLLILTQGYALG
jgi:hypothetical protein